MTNASAAAARLRLVLAEACREVGLDFRTATLVRSSENILFRLPGRIVARIGRQGQLAAAAKEVNVARWLESAGVPTVETVPDVDQPVDVDGRPVTFWRELPPHQPGTPAQLATALRRLHTLDPPTLFSLPPLDPFVRLPERIDNATTLPDDDREWMRNHLAELRKRYANLPAGLPACVVHGDAWVGNIVSTSDGRAFLLDLERSSIGPPEWDLVHTAIKHSSFGWITAQRYGEFRALYGHDVSEWDGFALLRDIREFRMTCMAVQLAEEIPSTRAQATHRLASLRGAAGPRPWADWHPVP